MESVLGTPDTASVHWATRASRASGVRRSFSGYKGLACFSPVRLRLAPMASRTGTRRVWTAVGSAPQLAPCHPVDAPHRFVLLLSDRCGLSTEIA
jgi:hypothetical protein